MTDLVADRELVVRVAGPGEGRKRDGLDVVGLAPGARRARHDGVDHRDQTRSSRGNINGRVHPEGAREAARLGRLVPGRVQGDLRHALEIQAPVRAGAGDAVEGGGATSVNCGEKSNLLCTTRVDKT